MRRIVLFAALLALVSPGPAVAGTWTDDDREGDVTRNFYAPKPPPCGTSTSAKKPGNKKFDITRLSVDHSADAVTLEVGVRDLRPRQKFFAQLELRTPGRDYWIDVDRYKANGPVDVFLAKVPKIDKPSGCGVVGIALTGIYCEQASAEADTSLNVIRVTLLRSCVKSPGWVRAGASLNGFRGRNISFHDRWGRKQDEPKDNWLLGPLGPRVHAEPAPAP